MLELEVRRRQHLGADHAFAGQAVVVPDHPAARVPDDRCEHPRNGKRLRMLRDRERVQLLRLLGTGLNSHSIVPDDPDPTMPPPAYFGNLGG